MTKVADIMILNLLTILFSVPIITGGAAITALYAAMLKLQADEGTVWNNFWEAFKSNLKQATGLWILTLVSGGLLGFSLVYYLGIGLQGASWLMILGLLPLLLWGIVTAWIFPLQCKFYNTVKGTLHNALLLSIGYLPRSILMMLLNLLPVILLVVNPYLLLKFGAVLFLLYVGTAAWFNCKLLQKPLSVMIAQLENQEKAPEEIPEEVAEEA